MQRTVDRRSDRARKADTRAKIEHGGLIRKAGLADEPAHVLLGILLDAQSRLREEEGQRARQRWAAMGSAAFTGAD